MFQLKSFKPQPSSRAPPSAGILPYGSRSGWAFYLLHASRAHSARVRQSRGIHSGWQRLRATCRRFDAHSCQSDMPRMRSQGGRLFCPPIKPFTVSSCSMTPTRCVWLVPVPCRRPSPTLGHRTAIVFDKHRPFSLDHHVPKLHTTFATHLLGRVVLSRFPRLPTTRAVSKLLPVTILRDNFECSF